MRGFRPALAAVLALAAAAPPAPAQDAMRDQLLHLRKKRPFGVLWVEAVPNLKRLRDAAAVKELVKKCKDANLKAIAVGVNTTSGEWLIPSKVAPVPTDWEGTSLLPPVDYLQTVIDEAQPLGLEVHVAVKIFCGGDKKLKRGVVYQSHPDWATVLVDATEKQEILIRPTMEFTDGKVGSDAVAYLNPVHRQVQDFGVNLVEDVLEQHPKLDGVVLEEVRQEGVHSDFSPTSEKLFRSWLEKEWKKKVKEWPKEVMEVRRVGDQRMIQQGPYYKEWVQWRAQRMREWVYRVKEIVRRKRPNAIFGVTVSGVYARVEGDAGNWGSDNYTHSAGWASKMFYTTGYAQYADYVAADAYAAALEGPSDSVDARLKEIVAAVAVDQRQELYPGVNAALYAGKPDDFRTALMKALSGAGGQGLKIHDLSTLEETGYWRIVAEVFAGNAAAFPEVK